VFWVESVIFYSVPCDSRSQGIAASPSGLAAYSQSNNLESLLSNVRSGDSRKEEFSW